VIDGSDRATDADNRQVSPITKAGKRVA